MIKQVVRAGVLTLALVALVATATATAGCGLSVDPVGVTSSDTLPGGDQQGFSSSVVDTVSDPTGLQ